MGFESVLAAWAFFRTACLAVCVASNRGVAASAWTLASRMVSAAAFLAEAVRTARCFAFSAFSPSSTFFAGGATCGAVCVSFVCVTLAV